MLRDRGGGGRARLSDYDIPYSSQIGTNPESMHSCLTVDDIVL